MYTRTQTELKPNTFVCLWKQEDHALEPSYAQVAVVSSTESIQTEKIKTIVKDMTERFSPIPYNLRFGISKQTIPNEVLWEIKSGSNSNSSPL